MHFEVQSPAVDEVLASGSESDLSSSNFTVSYLISQRPLVEEAASGFMETRASFDDRTRVISSGIAEMEHGLRAVAGLNSGGSVRKGEKRWDVDLHWDDRMAWRENMIILNTIIL